MRAICAIDIPGSETEALGAIAREYNAFVMGQAKAHHPDWKDRFFNVGFVIDPKVAKSSLGTTRFRRCFPWSIRYDPHDIFDWWCG